MAASRIIVSPARSECAALFRVFWGSGGAQRRRPVQGGLRPPRTTPPATSPIGRRTRTRTRTVLTTRP